MKLNVLQPCILLTHFNHCFHLIFINYVQFSRAGTFPNVCHTLEHTDVVFNIVEQIRRFTRSWASKVKQITASKRKDEETDENVEETGAEDAVTDERDEGTDDKDNVTDEKDEITDEKHEEIDEKDDVTDDKSAGSAYCSTLPILIVVVIYLVNSHLADTRPAFPARKCMEITPAIADTGYYRIVDTLCGPK